MAAKPFGFSPLFLFFAKVESVLFGSGYVLLAFLRADLVERRRWLTEAELLNAVAIGQDTPGPVFTTAPSSDMCWQAAAISGRLVPRLRRSRIAGAFLDGVNAASLALMAVVTGQLGRQRSPA